MAKPKYTGKYNIKSKLKRKFLNGGPEGSPYITTDVYQATQGPTQKMQTEEEQRKAAMNSQIYGSQLATQLDNLENIQNSINTYNTEEAKLKQKETEQYQKEAGAAGTQLLQETGKAFFKNLAAKKAAKAAAKIGFIPKTGTELNLPSNNYITSWNADAGPLISANDAGISSGQVMPEMFTEGTKTVTTPNLPTTSTGNAGLVTNAGSSMAAYAPAIASAGLTLAGIGSQYAFNRSDDADIKANKQSGYYDTTHYSNKELAGQVLGSTLKGAGMGIGVGGVLGAGIGAVPAALIGGGAGLAYGIGKAIHEKRQTTAEGDRGIKIGGKTYGKKLLFGDENVYSKSKDPYEIAKKEYEENLLAQQRIANAQSNTFLTSRKTETNTGFPIKSTVDSSQTINAKYGGSIEYLKGGVAKNLGRGAKEYVGRKHEQGGIDLPGNIEVEGGETEQNNYIFSASLKLPNGQTYAQTHKNLLASGASPEKIKQLALSQEAVAGRNPNEIKTMKFAKYGGPLKYDKGGKKKNFKSVNENNINGPEDLRWMNFNDYNNQSPPEFDLDRALSQVSVNEQNYFRTKANLSESDWEKQEIDNSGATVFDTPEEVKEAWTRILGEDNKKKEKIWNTYSDMPAPLKDIAVDHLFNASTDPRIFTLAAAGVISMNQSLLYKKDKDLLDKKWNENKEFIKEQYNNDPQVFTKKVSDNRNLLYAKARTNDVNGKLTDYPSNSGTPGVQYKAWKGRTDLTQDYLDNTYFNGVTYGAPDVKTENKTENKTIVNQVPIGVTPPANTNQNPPVNNNTTTNTNYVEKEPTVTYITSKDLENSKTTDNTAVEGDGKPRLFMGASRIIDENGNVKVITDKPIMGHGALAGSRLGTLSADGLENVQSNSYYEAAASLKKDADYAIKNTGKDLSFSNAITDREKIAGSKWGEKWGYKPGMSEAEASAAHDAYAAEMRNKFDQAPDEMLGYYQYIIDTGYKEDDNGNRTYGDDSFGDDARAIYENLKSKGHIDDSGKIKPTALTYLKEQATNRAVGPIHNAAGAYSLKDKPEPVKIIEKKDDTPPPKEKEKVPPPYLPPYKEYKDPRMSLVQAIPAAMALGANLDPVQYSPTMASYGVGPTAIGLKNLPRVQLNAERAGVAADTAAVNEALTNMSGPGAIAGMIAARSKADTERAKIAEQESNINKSLIAQEATLQQQGSMYNASQAAEAEKLRAQINMTNAAQQSEAAKFGAIGKRTAAEYGLETKLGAGEKFANALLLEDMANRQMKSNERIAAAADYTGSYDRRVIKENLEQATKDPNSELYGKSLQEVYKLVPEYYKQMYGEPVGIVTNQNNSSNSSNSNNSSNNSAKKFGGPKRYVSRLGELVNKKNKRF